MPSRVVKQPNGLLAVFSEVVDDFAAMDMTEVEALDYWLDDLGRKDAAAKVRRGLDDDMDGIGPVTAADGLNRWRDALATVRTIHGQGVAAEREAIGTGDGK